MLYYKIEMLSTHRVRNIEPVPSTESCSRGLGSGVPLISNGVGQQHSI